MKNIFFNTLPLPFGIIRETRPPDNTPSDSPPRVRLDASQFEVAGRAHRAAQFLLVHVQRPAFVVEIVEQFQVLAFRNPGNLVLCPEPFPLVQPPAAFAGIARPADTDRVVGNVRTAAGSRQDVLCGQRAFCCAVDARSRIVLTAAGGMVSCFFSIAG